MDSSNVLSELKVIYKDQRGYPPPPGQRLTESDVQRWAGTLKSRSVLYDEVARYLAFDFQSSELTFEFCDAVVNDLHGVIITADDERPRFFWAVYLAFDEGEYYHGNNRDEDPVEAYTRPMIAAVLNGDDAKEAIRN